MPETTLPTVAQVAGRFLASRQARGLRSSTLRWYWSRLSALPLPLPFARVTGPELAARLDRLTAADSPSTRKNYGRAWSALWTWAARNGIDCQPHIPAALYREGRVTDSKGAAILTVEDAGRIMANLAPAYLPGAAVLLFCGLRPEELRGPGKPPLTFGALNVPDRIIRVPAEVAKTRKWRVLENLPDALWRFIPTGRPATEPISPVSSARMVEQMQLAGGFMRQSGGKRTRLRKWPHDGTRHSFASYALALTKDAARVANWLGHEGNTTMLHRHYLGLATRAEAERYFAISPQAASPSPSSPPPPTD